MPARAERDISKPVFFKTSEKTYSMIKKYAIERDMTLATAISVLCREGIERYEARHADRSAA